ncbi:MAG: ROK family transcriptional regulator [Clostridia bacterium]|nr:ROK family transcriptional regulator [Clostridia bacterium]
MKKTGINLENVKRQNKASVLTLLKERGPMSRKDIAAEVGLTPASVTMLTNEMIEAGYLQEMGELQEEKRAGRRKILLSIVYDWKCVLAISIEVHNTTVSLCDLNGNALSSTELKTNDREVPEHFLEEVAKVAKALVYEAGKGPGDLLGAGVSLPGIVDRAAGVSKSAYGVWDREVPVADILTEQLHCPIVLENNIRAFAEGELLYGFGRSFRDLYFLRWGPGVGSAIVIEKKIYDGRGHRAGEVGHYNIDPEGLPCRCGRRGCLETQVSTAALTAKVRELFSEEKTPKLFHRFEGDASYLTEEVLGLLLKDTTSIEALDPLVAQVLQEAIDTLAQTFVNIGTILAPEHVVLFGSMFESALVREAFRKACCKIDPFYDAPYLQLAETSDKVSFLGSAAVAIHTYFLDDPH